MWGWTAAVQIRNNDHLNLIFDYFDLEAKYIAKYLLSTFSE